MIVFSKPVPKITRDDSRSHKNLAVRSCNMGKKKVPFVAPSDFSGNVVLLLTTAMPVFFVFPKKYSRYLAELSDVRVQTIH